MNQLHLLKNLGLAVVIVAIANRQVLAGDNIAKTNNRAKYVVPITQIRHLSHIEHPYKSVKEWLIAQQEAQTSQIIQVTRVRLKPTQSGLEVILESSISGKLQPTLKSEGNTLTALIPNAQLQLASGNFLRSEKPIAGIAEVTIRNQDANSILVTIAGETSSPKVELYDSDEGLIFVASASASSAEKPTPTPSPPAQRDTEGGEGSPKPSRETPPSQPSASSEEPIELVVTGEQDGYRVEQTTTGTKIFVPLRDIPLSVQVVPQAVIRDRGLTRLEEFTENVSGVTRNPANPFSSGYRVRGFGRGYQQLRNGFTDTGSLAQHGFANVERVEVLKGPASVLYGGNYPLSGVVNTITKKPLDQPFYQVNFTAGNYDFYRPTLDIAGPLTANGSLTYRLNASYESANSFQDFAFHEDYFIAPAFTWRIGPRTTLTAEYEYFRFSNNLFGASFPAEREFLRVPISRYLSEPDLGPTTGTVHWGYYDFEHRFSDNWKFRHGFSVRVADLDIGGERLASTTLQANRFRLNRQSTKGPQNNQLYTLQNEAIGKFKTGPFGHNFLFGVELRRFTYSFLQRNAPLAAIDIFNPVYGDRPGAYRVSTFGENGNDSLGIYLQDLIELTPNLKVLAGVRFDSIYSFSENKLTNRLTEQSKTKFSPRFGIVYQPTNSTSTYFNWAQAFFPNNGVSRTQEAFEPEIGEQFEFGIKQDFFDNRVSATLAFYQITRQNVLTADPDPQFRDRFSVVTGEQRSRGIELDVAGEILPGWNIIATYAYTDAEVTKDNRIPIGDRLPGVPYHSASIWTTYELQRGTLQGLGFGLGLTYTGEFDARLPNTFDLPSYLKVDAGLFYRQDNFRIGLNFKNLFSTKYYYIDSDGTALFPGSPFTVLGTVSVNL